MKKILAVVTCVLLCVLLFLFMNSWIGNPVSGSLAKKAAKQYIDTNYSDLKLKIKKSNYNMKLQTTLRHGGGWTKRCAGLQRK